MAARMNGRARLKRVKTRVLRVRLSERSIRITMGCSTSLYPRIPYTDTRPTDMYVNTPGVNFTARFVPSDDFRSITVERLQFMLATYKYVFKQKPRTVRAIVSFDSCSKIEFNF